jgi:hypothetical protein
VLAGKKEQPLAICFDVVAVEQAFGSGWHYPAKPKFPVNERKVASVLAVGEPAPLDLVVAFRMLVPQNVEAVIDGFSATEQQVSKLGFPLAIEAHDFPIENAAATPQVASESLTQVRKRFECVSVSRHQTHAVLVRIKDCPEPIPFQLKNPVWVRKCRTGAAQPTMAGIGEEALESV